MTNYEKITNCSIKELARFLDEKCWNDDAPWTDWFNGKYCNQCETIECHIEIEGPYFHSIQCSYCELEEGKCRFFDHYLEPEEVCEKWLEATE